MRIALMLRHYDQHGGGVKVYTHQLIRALFELPADHEYVLLYRNPSLLGTHAGDPRVREVVVRSPSVLTWDQFAAARAAERHKVDLVFNTKYSVPLTVRCPTAWVCHGLDWYVMPWGSRWMDRLSHRYLVPRYARKAKAIIAVSETTREHVLQYLAVPPQRVHTVYSGVADTFRQAVPMETLDAVRRTHGLPERFFLYVGAVYPPKNFARLIRAYAQVGPARGIALVVAGGENRFLSEAELELPERLGLSQWVRRPGWISAEELPAFYAMAQALLLPSLYESFGLPILEAMASGCPVVTANRYGTKELAGDAALLVDPEDEASIADALVQVVERADLRASLSRAGPARARAFTWRRCAEQTVRVLESIA